MTRIETEVYKHVNDDLIGLKVITYDDNNRVIDNVIVVEPEDLIRLQNGLIEHDHDNIYATLDTVNETVRSIAEEFFASPPNYRPPTFYVEENGNFYVEYHEDELISVSEAVITPNSTNINTYDGTFNIEATITLNDEPLISREVILYNLNNLSEYYFKKTNALGVVSFDLTTDVAVKNYIISSSGSSEGIQVNYHKYELECEVGTIADEYGDAIIPATITLWDNPVEDATVKLTKNNAAYSTEITDENGEVEFPVRISETTYYDIEFEQPNNEIIKKEFGVQCHLQKTYHFKLDGTESVQDVQNGNASGRVQFIEEDGENIMTGLNGYINEIVWSNDFLWTLECDLKLEGFGCCLSLDQNGITQRDKFHIAIVYENGYCMLWCRHNGGNVFNVRLQDENNNDILFNEWKHIVLRKTSLDTLELEIDGYIATTQTSVFLTVIKNHCLGVSYWRDNHYAYIKNATITYYDTINSVLKETYHPLLDGTEQLTTIASHVPVIHDNELDNFWDFCSGYLSEGWLNTDYWKLEFEIIRNTDSDGNCGCQITKKGITSRDSNRLFIGTQGNFVVHGVSGREFEDGYYRSCAYSSTSEWTKITVEKIGPQTMLITTKTPTCEQTTRLPWPSMPQYEYLTIGTYCWSKSGCRIRNIYVYTSLEDTLNTIE